MRAVRPKCSFSKLDVSCSRPLADNCTDRLAQGGASACKTNISEEVCQRWTSVMKYKMRIVWPGGEVEALVRQTFGGC